MSVSLSIIIPTFNSEKTIAGCIESITEQTFKPAEILVMDNVSTDGTIDIVNSYANSYPFIRAISEKDKGVFDAMNKGIKIAKGEWLYFIGSDDRLYDNNVLESVFEITVMGQDVIYGNVESEMLGGIYDGAFDIEKIFSRNICHQAIFFRKSIFKISGLFDTRFKAHADWHHNLKWLRNNHIRKLYIDRIIAHFAAGGISSHHKDNLFDQMINWEKTKHQKTGVSRINRLRMIKSGLKNAVFYNSSRLFFKIIAEAPLFMI